ncbi:hypothetical protein [Rhodohalobacter sp.]|uniref:hypothetical protein n=1 Tax=Rhodohalobacter sp. TaxID=1974210 RepID=UPI002ACE5A3C|nr:hypothetical protein [Rhodohalobacter sp.]MDZ7757890.1 hypothetical protein [Rhodohalobacter sp.]
MDEKERLKLAKKRRLELKKKEELNNLKRELKTKEQKIRQQEIREQHTGKYGDRIVIFFTTFGILYLFYYLISFVLNYMFGVGMGFLGISFGWLTPVIHILILGASVISAVRNRSIVDDIVDRF